MRGWSIHAAVKGILDTDNVWRHGNKQTVSHATEDSSTQPETSRCSRNRVQVLSKARTHMLVDVISCIGDDNMKSNKLDPKNRVTFNKIRDSDWKNCRHLLMFNAKTVEKTLDCQ
jgi:hypothetical protein